MDFGRDGLGLPVAATDLVERSNAIRLGKAEKVAPNCCYALGPRLIDPATAKIYPFQEAAKNQVFLCVFADPWRDDSARSSASSKPPPARHDVMLFPQGRGPDSEVRDNSWR